MGRCGPATICRRRRFPTAGLIVAVIATDRRNDHGLARPLVDEVARRYRRAPRPALFDKGYAWRADIAALAEHPLGPVRVYAPPPGAKPQTALDAAGRADRRYKRAQAPQAVKDWRARMPPPRAQAIFARRKLIERIHAPYKNRGLGRLRARGLIKTQAVALWHALANNLMVGHRLRAAAAAA